MKQKTRYKILEILVSVHEWPIYQYWQQKSHISSQVQAGKMGFYEEFMGVNVP